MLLRLPIAWDRSRLGRTPWESKSVRRRSAGYELLHRASPEKGSGGGQRSRGAGVTRNGRLVYGRRVLAVLMSAWTNLFAQLSDDS
jgi:hypothetical protein